MSSNKITVSSLISPSDIVSFLVIIAGILIAIYMNQPAIVIIGVCIAIIGVVALFMMISQRYSNYVQRKTPSSQIAVNRNIPENNKSESKIVFSNEKNSEDNSIENINYDKTEINDLNNQDETEDNKAHLIENSSAFDSSIISIKSSKETNDSIDNAQTNIKNIKSIQQSIENKSSEKPKYEQFDYSQDISGMRIIGKRKISKDVQDFQNTQQNEINIQNKKIDSNNKNSDDFDSFSAEELNNTENVDFMNSEGFNSLMMTNKENTLFNEPRREFSDLNIDTLEIIRKLTHSKTALFFIHNSINSEILIESVACENPENQISKYRFDIANDAVSQIILNSTPILITDIEQNTVDELLVYTDADYNCKSFAGVPIVYNNSILGALCIDSDKQDAYSNDTIEELEQWAKIFTTFVKNHTEKYDLLQKESILRAINTFSEKFSNNDFDKNSIITYLLNSLEELFKYDVAGVVTYDLNSQSWIVNAISEPDSTGIKFIEKEIELENSLILISLAEREKIFQRIDNKDLIRVYKEEKQRSDSFFAAIPMLTSTGHYGVIFMEGDELMHFTAFDMDILRILAEHAANTFEKIHLVGLLQNSMLMDYSLRLLNPNAFYYRIDEEISRAKDNNLPLTSVVIKIDKYESFEAEGKNEKFQYIVNHIIEKILVHLRKYDLFTRPDNDLFLLAFLNQPKEQVKFSLEKLRSDIANSMIEIDSKKFNVTISAGLASPTKDDNLESLIDKSYSALNIALGKTNFITTYE